MQFREFLRFEKKKLLIPFILIVLSIYVLYPYYRMSSLQEKYGCELASAIKDAKEDYQVNHSYQSQLVLIDNHPFFHETIHYYDYLDGDIFHQFAFYFINILDPILPYPCGVYSSETEYCEYYMSEETHDCFSNLNIGSSGLSSHIVHINEPPYRPLSVFTIIANLLLLFTEGYLISSIILCIYRKIQ